MLIFQIRTATSNLLRSGQTSSAEQCFSTEFVQTRRTFNCKKMNLSETLFAFLLTISCSLIRSSGFELRTSGYQLPQAPSELVQDQSWNKSNIFINVLCSGKQATVYTNLLYLECSDEHGCSTAHCLKTGSYFGIQIQSAFFVLFSLRFIKWWNFLNQGPKVTSALIYRDELLKNYYYNRRRQEIQFAVFLLCISDDPKNCSTTQTDKFRRSRDDEQPIFEAERQKRELS